MTAFDPRTDARRPLPDEAAEAARTTDYWAWLDVTGATPSGRHIDTLANGIRLVQLETFHDADFEALHMRHSIGHSWGKYSAIGALFSLRSADGTPQATLLVDPNGRVIHAREHENARLSEANTVALDAFAADRGWTVCPDPTPFDVLRDDDAPNTRFRWLHRDADNRKSIATIVLAGRLSDTQLADLFSGLHNERGFLPTPLGLEDLRTDPTADPLHEVLSVRYVRDAPTPGAEASRFHADWIDAVGEWKKTDGVSAGPRR